MLFGPMPVHQTLSSTLPKSTPHLMNGSKPLRKLNRTTPFSSADPPSFYQTDPCSSPPEEGEPSCPRPFYLPEITLSLFLPHQFLTHRITLLWHFHSYCPAASFWLGWITPKCNGLPIEIFELRIKCLGEARVTGPYPSHSAFKLCCSMILLQTHFTTSSLTMNLNCPLFKKK